MSKVRLEILPGLSHIFGLRGGGHLFLEEEIEVGETVKDLLVKLSGKYQGFAQSVFDVKAERLTGEVYVIVNDLFPQLQEELETKIRDGDTIVFLPALAGG